MKMCIKSCLSFYIVSQKNTIIFITVSNRTHSMGTSPLNQSPAAPKLARA
jgi:hypothetical protein